MANSRGVRLRDDDDDEINHVMDEMGLSFSGVISHVVNDWLHSRRSKQQRGDITLASEIIKNILRHIDKKHIKKIAEKNAKYVIEEMMFQVDDLDFNELSKRIMEWNNKENNIAMIKKPRKDSVMFMQKHHLVMQWSMHQCIMYSKMFELIGETIVPNSIKYDSNLFYFEVIRHK